MIKKLLIANRGEIALRVIKTCKKMGIESVTIFAEDDRNSLHVTEATESYSLGYGALSDTYLNQDKVIEIAKKTGATAIHPGYGFLSENAEFCKRVSNEGLTFIGPTVDAIVLMGDKKASKQKVEELGAPLVPGYHGDNQDEALLESEANKIGYPLLIKATAGGGGKGMRIVHQASGFKAALEAAKREAKNAFGDDKVLLEKYITNPRHIEVQVLSDSHGTHLHLYERECSIQRRYQKIIEETPSAFLTDEKREAICAAAVKISKGINYLGAGTVEFIYTQDHEFYFLEMNTRLQVEHPITEMCTGVDLVEWQIKIAAGEKLTLEQKSITQNGHSIECRIYSEDPDNGFLPTEGRVQQILGNYSDFRFDCALVDGENLSLNYDPMLAKVIVHSGSRMSAIEDMQDALDNVLFAGVKTNRDYLKRVLGNDAFIQGDYHTQFIDEEGDALERPQFSNDLLVSVIGQIILREANCVSNGLSIDNKRVFTLNDKEVEIDILSVQRSLVVIKYEAEVHKVVLDPELDLAIFDMNLSKTKQIFIEGLELTLDETKKVSRSSSKQASSDQGLVSPMPGKILKVLKSKNEDVKNGDPVLIMEAMKMEHTLYANKDGFIVDILFNEGDQVQGSILLAEIGER